MTATEPPVDIKAQLDTLMYASSRIELDDLYKLRHLVQKKYGIYYIQAADQNRDGLVNVNVIEKLRVKPPSNVFLIIRLKQLCKEKKFNYDFPEEMGDGMGGGNPYDGTGGNPYDSNFGNNMGGGNPYNQSNFGNPYDNNNMMGNQDAGNDFDSYMKKSNTMNMNNNNFNNNNNMNNNFGGNPYNHSFGGGNFGNNPYNTGGNPYASNNMNNNYNSKLKSSNMGKSKTFKSNNFNNNNNASAFPNPLMIIYKEILMIITIWVVMIV